MTREQVAQQRKRLEAAWSALEFSAEAQPQEVQRRAREGFAALTEIDAFLGELEANAAAGGAR